MLLAGAHKSLVIKKYIQGVEEKEDGKEEVVFVPPVIPE
jgi:hypothetical protein